MELKKFVDTLSAVKIENTENNKYALLSVTDKVNVIDMEDYKAYAFEFAITSENDTENLVIDFESKTERSLSACDKIIEEGFNEFTLDILRAEFDKNVDAKASEYTSTLENEFNAKFNELKTSYEDLAASYKVALEKLNTYEAKEADEKAKAHENAINALFDKYSAKLERCAEFLIYKAKTNPADVTLDEVNEKLTLMLGKYMMETQNPTKKNFSYTPVETGIAKKDNDASNKYGHLLDKYMK